MESRNKLTMCRLCLCENECFINIFEVNDCQGYVAAKVICDLLQFPVSETDIYPQVVCSKCLVKLTDYKLFKECCQKSKVMYDNMFVASESLEELKPEMDVGDGGSGLEFCEQDPLKEETSYPIIKQEELDISGDESEESKETDNKVGFGPMLLKHEVLSINRDSDTQDIGSYSSDSELSEQDPLGETSSHNDEKTFNLVAKEEDIDFNKVELTFVETVTHPKHLQCLENKRPHCTSDGYSCSNDDSIFEKSKNISLSEDVETSSSGTMERLECQRMLQGESINKVPLIQQEISIGKDPKKERERIEEDVEGKGERRRGTGTENLVRERREGLECFHCGIVLMSKPSLIHHMKVHGFVNSYDCAKCGKVFRFNCHLKTHVLTHTGSKQYKCAECSKCFSQKSNLNRHMRLHTGSKPYKCAECCKSFSQKGHLKDHMRLHTGSKPYNCAECSKRFSRKSSLNTHMIIHTGSKPYKCAECSKCFCENSSLKKHLRIHTGSKPHKCAECCKSFGQKGHLNDHVRLHTGSKPYKCAECSKCFSQMSHLKNHMRSHTGYKPYKCAECSKSFSQMSHLKKHMRSHTSF